VSFEENLLNQTELDSRFSRNAYIYKPDLVFGYNGTKVLLDVVTPSQTMFDTKQADGAVKFRQRIMKGLQSDLNSNVEAVSVTIPSIIDLDIPNYKLSLNQNFDFMQSLLSQFDKKTLEG